MITVFGSLNVDLVSRVVAAPRSGETVRGSDYALIPGGKGANQALAADRAGAEVRLIGTIGDDDLSKVALAELTLSGVDLTGVARRRGTTGLAIITVDEAGENTIVLSPGANAATRAAQIEPGAFARGDSLLLLQMEVPFAENLAVAADAAAFGARVVLSVAPFSPISPADLGSVSILIVNQHEAADFARFLGLAADDPRTAVTGLAGHLERTVIATLGPDGAMAAGPEGFISVPALAITPVDTTGAGDTFAGVLAAYLDRGADLAAAMGRAAIAGSIACTREGAQPSFPTLAEIEAAAGGLAF
jgi:ribokinase